MFNFKPGKIYRNVSHSYGLTVQYPLHAEYVTLEFNTVLDRYKIDKYLAYDETFVCIDVLEVAGGAGIVKILTESGTIRYMLLSNSTSHDCFVEVHDI